MKTLLFGFIGVFLSLSASAHEMVPTYPKWQVSVFPDVLRTQMELFNKREDVEYYEIGLFDSNWDPVPFVSSYSIMRVEYLGHVTFDVYINKRDRNRAMYLCSKSKLRKVDDTLPAVSSKICSKFKESDGKGPKVYSEVRL